MSLRQLTKVDAYFLVQYHEDNKYQVRRRGLIQTQDEVIVGRSYDVQWGRAKQVASADIISSGAEEEMKTLMVERQQPSAPKTKKQQKPKTPTVPAQKTKKQQQKKEKPAARVLFRSSGQADRVATASNSKEDPLPAATSSAFDPLPAATSSAIDPLPAATTSAIPRAEREEGAHQPMSPAMLRESIMEQMRRPLQSTPLRTLQNVSPLCRTAPGSEAGKSPIRSEPMMALMNTVNLTMEKMFDCIKDYQQSMNRKQDATNKRLTALEGAMTTVIERLDEMKATREVSAAIPQDNAVPDDDMFGDIPSLYRFTLDELRELQNEATGPGNFALSLTRKLYPELFGPGQLRLKYSYHGGGVREKQELDPERKAALVRYVQAFYPATKKTSIWKDSVIPKINEGLRRRDEADRVRGKKKASKASAENSAPRQQTQITTFNYTDQDNVLNASLRDIPQPFQPLHEQINLSNILNEISYDMTVSDY